MLLLTVMETPPLAVAYTNAALKSLMVGQGASLRHLKIRSSMGELKVAKNSINSM